MLALLTLFFQVTYSCVGCGTSCGLQTTANGTLSDGSGASNYANNANCEWMIAPRGALGITLSFSEFRIQPGNDVVRIYQCTEISCHNSPQTLAEWSGVRTSPQVVSTTGFMKVVFTSDASVNNYDGFTAYWSSVSLLPCCY